MRHRALVAALGVASLAAACRPAGPPPVVRVGLPDEEPAVRVGLAVEVAEVEVGSAGRLVFTVPGGAETVTAAGERWTFGADDAGRIVARGPGGRRLGPSPGPVRVRVRGGGDPVLIDGEPYRGGALVRAAGPGRVTAVNVLALEDYLLGVVPLEIGARPEEEIEAVKAQAVAARTYAISHLGSRESLGFDFYATVADQVYGGMGREHAVVSRAVYETRGEILTHEGQPILAYYHSTCGGRTAAVEEVWRRAPLPYLRSVSDRIEGTDDAYYCEISNRFRWTEHWTGEHLRAILSRTLAGGGAAIERVEAIEVTGRTPSGRAEALRIVADGRTHVIHGDSIRWILRPEPDRILNSSLFVLDVVHEGGAVAGLTAHGGGWGHGIGMCQMGAIGRARAGQDYRRILSTYYRGTDVVRLY